MMADIIDISGRPYEVAHTALIDAVNKFKEFGVSDHDIGKCLIANALSYLWDGEEPEAFKAKVVKIVSEEIENINFSIGS